MNKLSEAISAHMENISEQERILRQAKSDLDRSMFELTRTLVDQHAIEFLQPNMSRLRAALRHHES